MPATPAPPLPLTPAAPALLPPLAALAPSGGRRMSIVYTESWLTERDPMRLPTGSMRESRNVLGLIFPLGLLSPGLFRLLLLLLLVLAQFGMLMLPMFPLSPFPPTPRPMPTPTPTPTLFPLPATFISCICEMELRGGRRGVGDTSASIMLGGRTPLTLPPIE